MADQNEEKYESKLAQEISAMPRFQQLEVWAEGNDNLWGSCRGFCKSAISQLHRALEDYLESGRGQILFVPTIGDYDPNVEYALEDAFRIGDDSYFHVGLQFVLQTQLLVIPLAVKSFLTLHSFFGEFEIKIETHNKSFQVVELSKDQFEPICEYIFESIKEDLQDSLIRWIEHGQLPGQAPYIFYHPYPPEEATRFMADRPGVAPIYYGRSQPIRYWMTTQQAANYSGYDIEYVRRLIREGKVAAVKKGREWSISVQSLTNYIEEMKTSEDRRAGPKEIQ